MKVKNISMQKMLVKQQQGSVLLISLTILIILTLVTFSSSRNVLLQEKMTASTRQSMAVSEAVELALLEAESVAIAGGTYSLAGDGAGTIGYFRGDQCRYIDANCHLNTQLDLFNDATWGAGSTVTAGQTTPLGSVNVTGQYKIIYMGTRDISLTQDEELGVPGALYQGNSDNAAGNTMLFKVIASAQYNGLRKVVVAYFATVAGSTFRVSLV